MSARIVLQEADIARALTRISHEILESNRGTRDLVILGIPTRGVTLGRRIAENIARIEPDGDVFAGSLDVTMYRDDLSRTRTRTPGRTEVPASIDGATVVLVDDVLFSGRTVRAALDALNDLGRPSQVQLAVLVDRGHRQLPIRADYVGKNVPTSTGQNVRVLLAETDGTDAVLIADKTS